VFFLSVLAKDIQLLNANEDDRADEYLEKPIDQKDLVRRIETTLAFRHV
jgi:response regulator RpfG family c-di-GMP phosphodiesterase